MLKPFAKKILAIILYYSGLIKVIRLLGRNYAKILVFHSINDHEASFIRGTNVCIPPNRFEKHLKYIKKNYRVISLKKLVNSLNQGKVAPCSMVITFDDGFADNFIYAFPILQRYKINGTFFLATDCIDNRSPLWIQELYYLINNVGVERIIQTINTLTHKLKIPQLNIEFPLNKNLQEKVEEYMAFSLNKIMRNNVLATLYRKYNFQREKIFSQAQIYLNWDQIKLMKRDGIDFGNHGASHTPLSALPPDEQLEEITKSKKVIEQKIKRNFFPFSYPYGMDWDFTETTKNIIIDTGHSCALTAMATLNDENTSPYELGRIVIDNVPVHRLAFEIEKSVLKKYLGLKKD
jgi:peptidoglycan/xylan/chitin deacetylase (PgdA/CDA1 family)